MAIIITKTIANIIISNSTGSPFNRHFANANKGHHTNKPKPVKNKMSCIIAAETVGCNSKIGSLLIIKKESSCYLKLLSNLFRPKQLLNLLEYLVWIFNILNADPTAHHRSATEDRVPIPSTFMTCSY